VMIGRIPTENLASPGSWMLGRCGLTRKTVKVGICRHDPRFTRAHGR